MEKTTESSDKNKHKYSNFNSHLSDHIYDSCKKTLYSLKTDLQSLKDLQIDSKIESVVLLPTRFPLNEESQNTQETTFDRAKTGSNKGGYCIPETLRFSRKNNSNDISPSGLTITCKAKDENKDNPNPNKKYSYLSNISFKSGVHYWELICPISCSGIEFGVKCKQTLEQVVATFRTTTPRTIGVKLDLDCLKLDFYLDGRPQPKRSASVTKGDWYWLVNIKNWNTIVILNPFAQLSNQNVALPHSLLLSSEEKAILMKQANYLDNLVEDDQDEDGKVTITKSADEVPDEGSPQKVKNFEEKDTPPHISGFTNDHIVENLMNPDDFIQNLEHIEKMYSQISDLQNEEELKQDHDPKIMMLDYTDRLLHVKGNQLKVTARDGSKRFSMTSMMFRDLNDERTVLVQVSKDDMLSLITCINWKLFASLNNLETFGHVLDFLQAFCDAKTFKDHDEIVLFINFDYFKARIAVDAILSTVSKSLDPTDQSFNKTRDSVINCIPFDISTSESSFEDGWLFNYMPSLIKLLKSISVCLDIEEQLWISSKKISNKFDITNAQTLWSRIQSSYGRLASYLSWPSSKIHPILLSEAGLICTSDSIPKLSHYLEYNSLIEDDILSYIYMDSKSLHHALEAKFPNNLMLKGFNAINVPLYKTINYHPPSAHTAMIYNESGVFQTISSSITHVLCPNNTEFLASANQYDGSVCIWNSILHLFLVGQVNFKYK